MAEEKPSNDLSLVRLLAADEAKCRFFDVVLESLRSRGWDSDELRALIETELGEMHFISSRETEKYLPETMSDSYSIWVDDLKLDIYIKLAISDGYLWVTSFKKDDRRG